MLKGKRLALIPAITLLLSLTVSGCSLTNPNYSAKSGDSGETHSEAAASQNTKQITVNWWTWQPSIDQGKSFVDAFSASHPNIKLQLKTMQYNDYVNALKLSVISGTDDAPDIIGLQAGSMIKFYNEYLEDLAPYAAKSWGDQWQHRFVDLGIKQLLDGSQATTLPFFISASGYLWYNKTIFDEHGLKPPANFTEWIDVHKKLSAKGITPFIQGAKDAWIDLDTFIVLANEFGAGKVYEAEQGKIPWTDPVFVKALRVWQQMFDQGIMGKGALGISHYPDADDKFSKGEVAMMYNGTWSNNRMTKTEIAVEKKKFGMNKDYEFAPVLFPDMTGHGAKGKLFGGPDVAYGIYKNSKVKDAAWEVLEWLTSEQAQTMNAKNGNIPAIKGILLDDSDMITDFQKQALKAEMNDLNDVSGKREFLYPEIGTALKDAMDRVATHNKTPEQALADVDIAYKKIKK